MDQSDRSVNPTSSRPLESEHGRRATLGRSTPGTSRMTHPIGDDDYAAEPLVMRSHVVPDHFLAQFADLVI